MASLSEIVSVEDTPSGLITVVDETAVRAEVAAWRAKVLKRPGPAASCWRRRTSRP